MDPIFTGKIISLNAMQNSDGVHGVEVCITGDDGHTEIIVSESTARTLYVGARVSVTVELLDDA